MSKNLLRAASDPFDSGMGSVRQATPVPAALIGRSEAAARERTMRAADSGLNATRLRAQSLIEAAALATLEKLSRGVLLIDVDAIVRFMNRAARTIIEREHGFALCHRRLTFSDATVIDPRGNDCKHEWTSRGSADAAQCAARPR